MSFLANQERIQIVMELFELMESNPNDPLRYLIAGIICWNGDDYDGCITQLTKAIELAPNLAEAYYGRGKAYKAIGNHVLANADFAKTRQFSDVNWVESMRFSPNDSRQHLYQGMICYNQDDYDRAIVNFTTAIELAPNLSIGYFCRGVVYEAIGFTDDANVDFAKVRQLRNELE